MAISIVNGDWNSVRQALQYLDSIKFGAASIPSFDSVTLSGLTANRLVRSNASKQLVSTDLFGFIAGTAKRVTVADDGDGTVTLSGPQDLDTVDSPTFNGLTLTSIQLSATTITGAASITTGTSFKIDTTSGDFSVGLPALAGNGRVIMISCDGVNTATIDPDGTETINGDTTFDLIDDESIILVDFGTEWRVM